MLLTQMVRCAVARARARAGNKIAARIAMMAMTTNSSINVNPAASRAAGLGVEAGGFDLRLNSFTHDLQMQVRLRKGSGTCASSASGISTWAHQHMPLYAADEQS